MQLEVCECTLSGENYLVYRGITCYRGKITWLIVESCKCNMLQVKITSCTLESCKCDLLQGEDYLVYRDVIGERLLGVPWSLVNVTCYR